MDIQQLCTGKGAITKLARAVDAPHSTISRILSGDKNASAAVCMRIIIASEGAVGPEDLPMEEKERQAVLLYRDWIEGHAKDGSKKGSRRARRAEADS